MFTHQALITLQHWALKFTEVGHLYAAQLAQHPLIRNTAIASATLGLLFWVNHALNRLSLDNWTKAKRWDNKYELVLITGGCSGIGKAIASSLAKKEVQVVVLDIKDPEVTQDENVAFYHADVTSSESIHDAAIKIRAEHGNPTVLINNAGVGSSSPILEKSEARIRQVFNVNTISHFLMVQEYLPDMIRNNHGHIVTVASVTSFVGLGGWVDYCCSKASALAFHEGLSQELSLWYDAPKVRTSIFHPAWVRTPLIESYASSEKVFKKSMLEPEVVAEAVVKQILTQRGGQIILPENKFGISLLRALPHWIQRGINAAADKGLKVVYDERLRSSTGTNLQSNQA